MPKLQGEDECDATVQPLDHPDRVVVVETYGGSLTRTQLRCNSKTANAVGAGGQLTAVYPQNPQQCICRSADALDVIEKVVVPPHRPAHSSCVSSFKALALFPWTDLF